MGFFEGLANGALSLADFGAQALTANPFQSKESAEKFNNAGNIISLSKDLEEFVSKRTNGQQTAGNIVGTLTNTALTNHLLESDNPILSNPLVAKAVGAVAGHFASKIVTALADKVFPPQTDLNTTYESLVKTGRLPANPADLARNPDMVESFLRTISGKSDSAVSPSFTPGMGGGSLAQGQG